MYIFSLLPHVVSPPLSGQLKELNLSAALDQAVGCAIKSILPL